MSTEKVFDRRVDFYYLAFFLLCIGSLLATIPLGTSFSSKQKYEIKDELLIGPLEVSSFGSTFRFEAIRKVYRHGDWVSVQADVLDENKAYLFSIADELWHETGRDSDGPWSETHDELDTKFSLAKGKYYIAVEAEYSNGVKPNVLIRLKKIWGTTSLLYLTSIISGCMLLVLVMFEKDTK